MADDRKNRPAKEGTGEQPVTERPDKMQKVFGGRPPNTPRPSSDEPAKDSKRETNHTTRGRDGSH